MESEPRPRATFAGILDEDSQALPITVSPQEIRDAVTAMHNGDVEPYRRLRRRMTEGLKW